MKTKKNNLAQWTLTAVLGVWMAASVMVFLSEPSQGSDVSVLAIVASKALAALSGWACVKVGAALDKAGWLPNIDYFVTNEEGNEL